MKVSSKLLWQAVKNVSTFSRKDGWAGAVKVRLAPNTLWFFTSDDFVGIQSVVEVAESGRAQHEDLFLSHESVRELEKWLREKQDETLEMMLTTNVAEEPVFQVAYTDERAEELGLDMDTVLVWLPVIDCPDEGWWNMFEYVMGHVNAFPESLGTWELDPARLSKMNLLEPKAEYPLALSPCSLSGDGFVAFRYGPNTQGMIKPLDREKLKEVYKDRIGDVLWEQ